jgi:hypothetical protein
VGSAPPPAPDYRPAVRHKPSGSESIRPLSIASWYTFICLSQDAAAGTICSLNLSLHDKFLIVRYFQEMLEMLYEAAKT